jgi:hypothetical protein
MYGIGERPHPVAVAGSQNNGFHYNPFLFRIFMIGKIFMVLRIP